MKRLSFVVLAIVVGLSACGEKTQDMTAGKTGNAGPAGDTAAHTGTSAPNFTQAGWKAGDKAAWQQHLKARLQNGQNDYSRMP
jgi:hypothetical protein